MAQKTKRGGTGRATGFSSGTSGRKKSSGRSSSSGRRASSGRSTSAGTRTGAGRKSSSVKKSSSRSAVSRKAAAVRKARQQKMRREREIRTDIALVVMLIAVVLICLSLAGFCGSVGSALAKLLFGCFGIGAWCVPVWNFVLCFYLLTQRGGRQMPARLTAGAVLILILQSAGHLYLHTSARISLDAPFNAKETFSLCAENAFGGGIFGGWFARLLYRAFGAPGSVLVYIGAALIFLMILLQRSPAEIFRSWSEHREEEGIPAFFERQAMRRQRRRQELEEEEEARLSREADRILRREGRAASRARQGEQAGGSRMRRGAEGSPFPDLENMLLEGGTAGGKASEKSYGMAESGSGSRKNAGRIDTMDGRKDVHEIIVLPEDAGEPMTVAAGAAPQHGAGGGTHDSSSGPGAGDGAGLRAPGNGSLNTGDGDGPDTAGEAALRAGYNAGLHAAGIAEPDVSDNDGAAAEAAGDPAAVSSGNPGGNISRGTGFTAPSEEELEGISVHRETQDAKSGSLISRRTAAARRGNNYVPPTFSLLERGSSGKNEETERELKETAYRLQETLRTFGVQVAITDISQGPSVTRYELKPDKGVKVSRIVNLSDDIKLRLAATDIRIEAPIPGKSAIGIEVPNKRESTVHLRDLLEPKEFRRFEGQLPFAVGKDIGGKTVIADIARMPHLLIAGATGSGKSVCINTIILSILYRTSPEKVRLLMIDPKVVELSVYRKIPHLIIPVVTDARKASAALNWAVAEMEKRYKLFAAAGARDLSGYNSLAASFRNEDGEQERKPLPRIVIIVDELADLMMIAKSEVESAVCRLAQLARAAGIHLIIATQRPSVDVITGLIKANMPSRIAFAVSSQVDSRTILDMAGAEKLIGKGDMLFYPQSYQKPARIQGAFVSDHEVKAVVDYIKKHNAVRMHDEEIDRQIEDIAVNGIPGASSGEVKADQGRDEHFEEAGRFIIEKNKASIGLLQRVFKIGFNRAARIMDQLAEAGVVSEESSTRARQVLMSMPEFEAFLENE